MNLTPLGNRLVIRKSKTKPKSGILLLNDDGAMTFEAEVIKVSPYAKDRMDLKEGDKVLMPRYGSNILEETPDYIYYLTNIDEVLGVL